MRVVTLFGTRPEIIRLSRVIAAIDAHAEHVLVHTGQNYDPALSDVFFEELALRQPDVHLGVVATSFAEQAALILQKSSQVFAEHRPDRLLILGDTNSGLAAIVAARQGIPVYHMEAGNRCFDDRVPEEINRRIIDHSSTVLMPYTQRSKENLVREGIERERIFVTGNPIFEVMEANAAAIERSDVLARLGVAEADYFLVTLHRAENVDLANRLRLFMQGLARIADEHGLPVLVSVHPRTAARLDQHGITAGERVRLLAPLGFHDFVRLERSARAVLSDSGTVQEECCILGVPNVTLRDVTERAETVECGSNILSGVEPADVARSLRVALSSSRRWTPPPEYVARDVSRTVAKIVLGHTSVRRHVSPA